jgi:FKBP-type peptidyl-prolyl cis-trans isomerase 2
MKEGDIVELEFDAFIKETDELIETTHEEMAKEHDMFDENRDYNAIPVIVGKDKSLAEGLNEHILKADVGKDLEVEIPPDKGFGVRDTKLVELHSKREIMRLPEFSKGDAYPYIGMQIVLKNRPAWISSITAGRIRIDFNHRLAGKTLLYKYKVTKKIDKLDDKVKAIMQMHYASKDEFGIKVDKKKKAIELVLPEICKYDSKWTLAKYGVIADLRDVTGMETIRFIEEYVKKEEPKKEEKNTEATLETKEEAPTEEETSAEPEAQPALESKDSKEKEEAPPEEEKKEDAPEDTAAPEAAADPKDNSPQEEAPAEEAKE